MREKYIETKYLHLKQKFSSFSVFFLKVNSTVSFYMNKNINPFLTENIGSIIIKIFI